MDRVTASVAVAAAFAFAAPFAAARADDKAIESEIKAIILQDPILRDSRHIKIKVRQGVAYLYGRANSLYDKMQAGLYAEKVDGVTEVHNCIKVRFMWPWEDEACGNMCEDPVTQWKWY